MSRKQDIAELQASIALLQTQVKAYDAEWFDGNVQVMRDQFGRFAKKSAGEAAVTGDDPKAEEEEAVAETETEEEEAVAETETEEEAVVDRSNPIMGFAGNLFSEAEKFTKQELEEVGKRADQISKNAQQAFSEMKISIPSPPKLDIGNIKQAGENALKTLAAAEQQAEEFAKQGVQAADDAVKKFISDVIAAASAVGSMVASKSSDAFLFLKDKMPNADLGKIFEKLPKFGRQEQDEGQQQDVLPVIVGAMISGDIVSGNVAKLGDALKSVTEIKPDQIKDFLHLSSIKQGIDGLGAKLNPKNLSLPDFSEMTKQAAKSASNLKNTAMEKVANAKASAIAEGQQLLEKGKQAYGNMVDQGLNVINQIKEFIDRLIEAAKEGGKRTAAQTQAMLEDMKKRLQATKSNSLAYEKAVSETKELVEETALESTKADMSSVKKAISDVEKTIEDGLSSGAIKAPKDNMSRLFAYKERGNLNSSLDSLKAAAKEDTSGFKSAIFLKAMSLQQQISSSPAFTSAEKKTMLQDITKVLSSISDD